MPIYVKKALQKLDDAGHVSYLVGGGVRDFLLGQESKDYDIATSCLPDKLCELFPKAITVGKAFGVIKVPIGRDPGGSDPGFLEIATFRQDLEYQDGRHPRGIIFSDPEQDARRRDFSINALFFDHKTLKIFDFTGGLEDLQHRIIRAIGNPSERFKEDALRLLRAVRFKTRLGFIIDATTVDAIRTRAKFITKVSPERIRDELTLMWLGPRPQEALVMLLDLGLLSFILPEVEALRGMPQVPAGRQHEDIWSHLLRTLACLAEQRPIRSVVLAWAAVLHEVGKPIVSKLNQGKNFNGHEIEGAKMAEKIAHRLRISRDESRKIASMVADHLKFKDVFQMRDSTLQRWIREEHFEELLAFHKADALALDGNLAYFEFCLTCFNALKKMPSADTYKWVDGTDLIQLGFKPGPEFAEILRVVEDLALEKTLKNKEEALEYVIKHFVK